MFQQKKLLIQITITTLTIHLTFTKTKNDPTEVSKVINNSPSCDK